MDFSKVKCPSCSDTFFFEKFWGKIPNIKPDAPLVRKCFCLCMNCASWFSFNVKNDRLVDGSYAIEETECMQDIEKSIIGDKHE